MRFSFEEMTKLYLKLMSFCDFATLATFETLPMRVKVCSTTHVLVFLTHKKYEHRVFHWSAPNETSHWTRGGKDWLWSARHNIVRTTECRARGEARRRRLFCALLTHSSNSSTVCVKSSKLCICNVSWRCACHYHRCKDLPSSRPFGCVVSLVVYLSSVARVCRVQVQSQRGVGRHLVQKIWVCGCAFGGGFKRDDCLARREPGLNGVEKGCLIRLWWARVCRVYNSAE